MEKKEGDGKKKDGDGKKGRGWKKKEGDGKKPGKFDFEKNAYFSTHNSTNANKYTNLNTLKFNCVVFHKRARDFGDSLSVDVLQKHVR